jgi:DNA repair protein RadD
MNIQLRPYQTALCQNVQTAFKNGHKLVLAVLPTGGGKTYTFTHMAKLALDKGKTVFFLVHKKGLVSQISESLTNFGIRHGIIGGQRPKQYYLKAQVCSVQSLINRLADPMLPVPDFIIIDEAHHSNAGTWKKIIDFYTGKYFLGVTATPIRTDGQGLGDIFNDMVLGPQIMELIDEGMLVMPRIFNPKSDVDVSSVKKTKSGDYNEADLFKAMDKPKITGDAVHKYIELAGGAPGVYFCVNIEHCKKVAVAFSCAGIPAAAVYGEMKEDELKAVFDKFKRGIIKVITSCNLISEGTDIPKIGCIGHLRPTQSLGLYMQMNGRGLRPCSGKDYCIIIDHVNNYGRHGHPCEDQEWSLEGRKKKTKSKEVEKVDKYNLCTSCFAVFSEPDKCPHCGTELEKPKVTEIEQVEGELVEVVFDKAQAEMERKSVFKEHRKQEGMCKSFEDFFNLAKIRGYENPKGWAWHRVRAREKQKK